MGEQDPAHDQVVLRLLAAPLIFDDALMLFRTGVLPVEGKTFPHIRSPLMSCCTGSQATFPHGHPSKGSDCQLGGRSPVLLAVPVQAPSDANADGETERHVGCCCPCTVEVQIGWRNEAELQQTLDGARGDEQKNLLAIVRHGAKHASDTEDGSSKSGDNSPRIAADTARQSVDHKAQRNEHPHVVVAHPRAVKEEEVRRQPVLHGTRHDQEDWLDCYHER
mmetsp:Transcript_93124/g.259391  ORF Transcript_93124/g.259391 Transcript_93124/m.259391 type:complete len:221 (+) Transcript_93124:460-1122(+)